MTNYYKLGVQDGYRQVMKAYRPVVPTGRKHIPLKTAFYIAASVKSDMVFANQLDTVIRNVRQLLGWAKDGTATKEQLTQIVTSLSNLKDNAPQGISDPLIKQLTLVYKTMKQAEAAWPAKEGGATNPNFFQLKKPTQAKVRDAIDIALEQGGAAARDIRAEANALGKQMEGRAQLYKELTALEPIIGQLKTTLTPAPGEELQRVEINVVRDVITRLTTILANPNLPPQFVAPLNKILDGLRPKVDGGGWLGTALLSKYYEWMGGNQREIEAALRQIVDTYGRIMKSVQQRKA